MSAGIAGLIFGLIIGSVGGAVTAAMFMHHEPEDPSITQKNNEALADYCSALLEQNKELKHAVRHCYNAMSEFEDITRELEEYL